MKINFESIATLWVKIQYFLTPLRIFHRYPYVLIGEVCNNGDQTILIYRLRGKRDIYQESAQEICNNPNLISMFHPLDVRTISYICGVEQAIEIAPERRLLHLALLKNKIFKK